MNKCAVIIGVDKTGGLPVLNAAGSGAIDMSNWANKQGFDITLLTDANDRPVTIQLIKKAIQGYLEQLTYEQLVVYFSGHGILKSPDAELWLLSGSPNDPNEAVNLSGSILMARNARLKHIVFISDACRSQPATMKLNQVSGSIIFPNEEPRSPRPAVDLFYATLPGDTALEMPPDQSVKMYRGIFTEYMLKGLNGMVSQVIVEMGQPPQLQRVVPAWQLKNYLESEVPLAASTIDLTLIQEPEVRVESHHPRYLSLLSQHTEAFVHEGAGDMVRPPLEVFERLNDSSAKGVNPSRRGIRRPIRTVNQTGPKQEKFNDSVNQLLTLRGKESVDIRTGFTIIGTDVKNCTAAIQVDMFREREAVQLRLPDEPHQVGMAHSILVEFANGTGVLLSILPGFMGTLIVEQDRLVTVNYTPSRHTRKFDEFEPVLPEIEKRRALVAVSARNGSLWLPYDRAVKGAGYLRKQKAFDPTVGLYAAYAYLQTGQLEEVQSVFDYMAEEYTELDGRSVRIPVLFDVALLAGKLSGDTPLAPLCPLLNQGWAYTEPYRDRLSPVILEASQFLLPGLWTTFESQGVAILKNAMTNQLIK